MRVACPRATLLRRPVCAALGGLVFGHQRSAQNGQSDAHIEWPGDRAPTVFRRTLDQTDYGVHDRGAGEDDRHHHGRGAAIAEGQQDTEGPDRAHDAGNQRPGPAADRKTPLGVLVEPKHRERQHDGREKVGNADEKKCLETGDGGNRRVPHAAFAGHAVSADLEKNAVHAPGGNGHQGISDPGETRLFRLRGHVDGYSMSRWAE